MTDGRPPIAAVADDLSGAAELAGVGWRRGLAAEVHTEPGLDSCAPLVVVDADSRTRTLAEARERSKEAGAWLAGLHPGLVYKKTDSVLRGWVRAETEALLATLGRRRALLVPANPSLGRMIREGRYLVGGRPVAETDFARDPLHPIASSDVLDMLGSEGEAPLCYAPSGCALPDRGIGVGEATSREDLLEWARRVDTDTLPAGAAEFFDALLESAGHALRSASPREAPPDGGRLLVSGSASEPSRRALDAARSRGVPVLPIPDALFQNDGEGAAEAARRWADSVADALQRAPLVAVAIDRPPAAGAGLAGRLVTRLAELVAGVLERRAVGDVLLEGGATAAAVIRRQGWKRLSVHRELAPGVVEMRTGEPRARLVTIKPGSYAWSEEIWR